MPMSRALFRLMNSLKAGRLIEGDVSCLSAPQDGVDDRGSVALEIKKVWCIGHQSAILGKGPKRINRGQTMRPCEVGNQAAVSYCSRRSH